MSLRAAKRFAGAGLTPGSGLSPVPRSHLYAQPQNAAFLAAQERSADEHPWFTVAGLDAASHFPTLQVPDETAAAVRRFVS